MTAYFNQEEISDAQFDKLTKSYIKSQGIQGVFETMRVDNFNGVRFSEKHLARLLRGFESIRQSAKIFNKFDSESIRRYFHEDTQYFISEMHDNHPISAIIRYQLVLDQDNPEQVIRMLKPRALTSPGGNKLRIKICNTTLPVNLASAGRKDIDRRVYDKAFKELTNNKFFDGLLCNQQGHVIEGIKTNVFAVRANNLYTPSLSQGGVAGIMREVFIERAQDAGMNIIISPMHHLELQEMDAVFLTNSVIGVVKVDYILQPGRKRSVNVFKPESAGFQNIVKLNMLKNSRLYQRV